MGKRGPLFITVRGPHYRGLSCCGAQAPDAQAQQLWLTGPVALRHVGSSQTRARIRVPCIDRQALNHCATREARTASFLAAPSPANVGRPSASEPCYLPNFCCAGLALVGQRCLLSSQGCGRSDGGRGFIFPELGEKPLRDLRPSLGVEWPGLQPAPPSGSLWPSGGLQP